MIKRLNPALWTSLLSLSLVMFASSSNASTQRIVSAGANITEILLALDAQQQLIAVDSTSQVPSQLKLPVVGYHRQLSAEGLLTLNPDAVIGSEEMGPASSLNQLQQAGVDIHQLNSGSSVASLVQRIDELAALTGHTQQAKQLQTQLQLKLQQLARRSQTAKPINTLFFMSHDGKKLVSAGKDTTADKIINLAGAVNLAQPYINSYKPLSNEAIISLQPEMLLFSQRSLSQLGGIDGILKQFPILAATPAGKNKAIYAIDGHALIGGLGLASIDQALQLSERLQ